MLTLTFALLMAAGFQNSVPVGDVRDKEAMVAEKESKLAAELAASMRRHMKVFESPGALEYLRLLEQRLAAPGMSYTFELITDSTNELQEPIALSGGYVFVPAGLFMAARDETEFAGMLAHAMAHVEGRHILRSETRIGRSTVPITFAYMPGPTALFPVALLEKARAFESEADLIAARKMDAAGYDPAALARYIERTQRDLPDEPRKFSALPPRATRIVAIQELVGTLPSRTYATSGEFERAKEEVRSRMPVRVFPSPDNPPRLRRP